jgi:hypothetical protein
MNTHPTQETGRTSPGTLAARPPGCILAAEREFNFLPKRVRVTKAEIGFLCGKFSCGPFSRRAGTSSAATLLRVLRRNSAPSVLDLLTLSSSSRQGAAQFTLRNQKKQSHPHPASPHSTPKLPPAPPPSEQSKSRAAKPPPNSTRNPPRSPPHPENKSA